MISPEIYTLIGKLTVFILSIYVLLIGPYVGIFTFIILLETAMRKTVEYFWQRWGGTSEKKPDKYGDQLLWIANNVEYRVIKFRRMYEDKGKWYEKNILMRLPLVK